MSTSGGDDADVIGSRLLMCAIVGRKETSARWRSEVADMAYHAASAAVGAGFGVVTGGLDGAMAAAAHGAKDAGGTTVGILPGTSSGDASRYHDIVVPTGISLARNVVTALTCDIMVAVPGGLGTLQEITYAREYGRPVLSWGAWSYPELDVTVVEPGDRDAVTTWLKNQHALLAHRGNED